MRHTTLPLIAALATALAFAPLAAAQDVTSALGGAAGSEAGNATGTLHGTAGGASDNATATLDALAEAEAGPDGFWAWIGIHVDAIVDQLAQLLGVGGVEADADVAASQDGASLDLALAGQEIRLDVPGALPPLPPEAEGTLTQVTGVLEGAIPSL